MDRTELASPTGRRRSLGRGVAGLLAVVLLSGTAVAGCSGSHDPATAGASAGAPAASMAAMPTMSGNVPDVNGSPMAANPAPGGSTADGIAADAAATWVARPAYVRSDSRTEEAYEYAMYHPQVIEWMPCYCGCAAMDHRSNLDCYYKPAIPGGPTQYEEHASYCDICVDTTLLAKQLMGEGKTLREIRTIVDQTFGGGAAPGTPTELPPA